jgi:hypothetical protein
MELYKSAELSNLDEFKQFIESLKIQDQVHFKTSDSNKNIEEITFMYVLINKLEQGTFAIFANPILRRSIKIDLNNPLENPENIISINYGPVPELEIITPENIEEVNEYIFELSEWNREYSDEELLTTLKSDIPDIFKITDVKRIEIESHNILDFIKSHQKIVDGFAMRDTKNFSSNYKPFLDNLINNNFNSNIFPIVADIKKYYTDDDDLLLNLEDTIENSNQVYFLKQSEELKTIEELYKRVFKLNFDNITYDQFIKYLYEGGSIEVDNLEDNTKELLNFKSINRPYLNDINAFPSTNYTTKIPFKTVVYRTCNKNNICKTNFNNLKSNNFNIAKSYRIADGPVITFVDKYEDALYTETKGRYGKISSCVGDDDKFVFGDKKNNILYHQMIKPPTPKNIIDGEELVIVGFYISTDKYIPTLQNSEIVSNSGDVKLYPKIKTSGFDITNIYKNSTKNNKEVIIIENIDEFKWADMNDKNDYMVFINKYENKTIDTIKYKSIIEKFLPSISDILNIESNNIAKCENFNQINMILNNYNLEVRDINKELINKALIKTSLIKNIELNDKVNKLYHSQYLISKSNSILFRVIYNEILSLKHISDSVVLNSNSLPNDIKLDTIKTHFSNTVISTLKQYTTEVLEKFASSFLNIEIDINDNRTKIIYKIIDFIIKLYPNSFVNTEFYKFFIKKNNLIHPEFEELFDKFVELYNIQFKEINNNNFVDFDSLKLAQIDFIKQLNGLFYSGKEFYELIDLSIYKYNQSNIDELIEKYARQEYESNTNRNWDDLDIKDRYNWYPNENMLDRIDETLQNMKDKYEDERRGVKKNVNSCGNLEIVKIYTSLSELENDNGKDPIFRNKLYDTLDSDINEYNKYTKKFSVPKNEKEIKDFINHLSTLHPFLSDKQLKNRYDDILRFINNNESCVDETKDLNKDKLEKRPYCRPVDKGDIALLIDNGKRFLYKRVQNVWVILDKSSAQLLQKCYNYDNKFLNVPFDELEKTCLNINTGSSDCIMVDKDFIPVNIFNIVYYQKFLTKRKENISKILEFKNNKDSYITKRIKQLETRVNLLQNIKNKNKRLIENKQYKFNPKIINPPKNISDELTLIDRIDDLYLKVTKLNLFVQKYGIPYNRNPIDGIDDTPDKSKKFYFDFDKVNVPICCKHFESLFNSNLGRDFEEKLKNVTTEWGILLHDQSKYTCKECGEILEMNRYSEFAGIGIFLREKVEPSMEDYDNDELEEKNFLSEELDIKYYLDNVIKVIGIKINNKDYITIIRKVAELINSQPPLNLHEFYFNNIKISPPEILQKKIQSNLYLKEESEFLREFGSFDEKTVIEYMFNNSKYLTLTPVIKMISILHNAYTKLYRLKYLTNFLLLTIITAIPDYYLKGTGSERKTKSVLLGDPFENQENTKTLIYDLVRNDIEFNNFDNKNDYSKIKKYLMLFYETNFKDGFNKEMSPLFNELQDSYYFQKRFIDKTEYKLKNTLANYIDFSERYKWNEFLPVLQFVDKKDFNLEDTKMLINSRNLSQLLYQEYKLSYSLFSYINHKLITDDTKLNYSVSSLKYLVNYLHRPSTENFNDYFNKNLTIKSIRNQLNDIYDFWKIYKQNKYNSSYLTFINPIRSNHLIQTKTIITRKELENKLQQLIFTYITTEGPTQGLRRNFTIVKDSDYEILTNIINNNPEINKEDLRNTLIENIKTKYPAITNDFLTTKLKIIFDNNGSCEIDRISGEFKSDLENKFNKIIKNITDIKELENLITSLDIIINRTHTNKLVDVGYLTRKNNIKIAVNKIIIQFQDIFRGNDNLFDKIIKIQNKYQYLNGEDFNEVDKFEDSEVRQFYKELDSLISKNYESSLNTFINNISYQLQGYKNMSIDQIQTILNDNIGNKDSYWEEIKNIKEIELEIKREGFSNNKIINNETLFREKLYSEFNKSDNINFHINLIQIIITVLQKINNKMITKTKLTQIDDNILTKNKYNTLIQSIDIIIDRINNTGDNIYINAPIEKIQKFLDIFISYELNINPIGNYNMLFINSPEIFSYFTKYILIYLLNLFTDDDLLLDILTNLFNVLKDTSDFNNLTDKDVNEVINLEKAKLDRKRKDRVAKMNADKKLLYYAYRNLNLGNNFADDEGITDSMVEPEEELITDTNYNIVSVKDITYLDSEFDHGDGQDNDEAYEYDKDE